MNITKVLGIILCMLLANILSPSKDTLNSKFPIVKKVKTYQQMTKLIFTEYILPEKIVSDVGMNFCTKTFKAFYRRMNIQQTIT